MSEDQTHRLMVGCIGFQIHADPLDIADKLAADEDVVPAMRPFRPLRGIEDAWRVCKGTELHAPTTGVFDAAQWPEGPHCRDYVFVSGELIRNVQGIRVDLETDASDHQPVRLILTHEAPGSPVTSS